jgi:hypothetical protein
MPSQHRHPPIGFRPPEADRAWLLAQAKEWDMAVNQLLTRALREYRARWESPAGLGEQPVQGGRGERDARQDHARPR